MAQLRLAQINSVNLSTGIAFAGFAIGIISTVIQIYLNMRFYKLKEEVLQKMDEKIERAVEALEKEMVTSKEMKSLEKELALKMDNAKWAIINELRK